MELSIENVPEDARSVRLCMTNSGRQVVYTFFEYALDDDRTSDIDLPSAQIDLLEYDRIQRLVFQQYNCVSCHQGESGAGGLLLTRETATARWSARLRRSRTSCASNLRTPRAAFCLTR